jgi:hypothetical protein
LIGVHGGALALDGGCAPLPQGTPFEASHAVAHGPHQVRLDVLHELRPILHRRHGEARCKKGRGCRVDLQLVQDGDDLDQRSGAACSVQSQGFW